MERGEAACDRASEAQAEIAELVLLRTVDVFADPAGKHHPVDAGQLADRIGQIEMLDRRGQRTLRERRDEQIRHVARELVELRG